MKIVVLGAGLVGYPMASDLAAGGFDVTLCDIRKERLEKAINEGIKTIESDLSKPDNIRKCTSDAELVISAVPGFMGYGTLRHLIELGKNVVDIAFFPEDLFQLDPLAKEKGVSVVCDAGVAPGMSNILTALSVSTMQRCDKVRIMVGGLPKERNLPYEYKAPFSPADVIEEYTRPARLVRGGKEIVLPALSEAELVNFRGAGTLEAFNSDGLRSLIRTIDCPDMSEKTLRYPGHIEKIILLRDTGFLSTEKIEINGQHVRPIDLTEKLLFPMWELKQGDEDITVMKIEVEGESDGKKIRSVWTLYDEFDKSTGIHSMARTTGYTATGIAKLVLEGHIKETGVMAPEMLALDHHRVDRLLSHLSDRGVIYENEIIAVS